MGRKFIPIPLLMFCPGSSPSDFHKLLKIPIALLRTINVGIIIFLDDMLVMDKLQNLRFVINFKKSQLTPVKEIEFLGLVINSVNMTM